MTIRLVDPTSGTKPRVVRNLDVIHQYIRNRPGEWIDVTRNVTIDEVIIPDNGAPGHSIYRPDWFEAAFPENNGYERCHATYTGWRRLFHPFGSRPMVRYTPERDETASLAAAATDGMVAEYSRPRT